MPSPPHPGPAALGGCFQGISSRVPCRSRVWQPDLREALGRALGPFDGEEALDSPRSRCLPRVAWVQGSQEEKPLGLALRWLCTLGGASCLPPPRRGWGGSSRRGWHRPGPVHSRQGPQDSSWSEGPCFLEAFLGAAALPLPLCPGPRPPLMETSRTTGCLPGATGHAGHAARRALPWCGGSRWAVNAEARLPWVTQLLVAPKPGQVCGRWAGD